MKKSIDSEKILILDFGSQYTQLIARRVREIGIFSEIVSHQISYKEILKINPKGIILSGGPESVYTKKNLKIDNKILESDIPILGICYGMQLIAQHFKGKVKTSKKSEFGNTSIKLYQGKILKKVSKKNLNVWMSHGDKVTHLPKGFKRMASSKNCSIAAIANDKNKKYGLQFHPELVKFRIHIKTIISNHWYFSIFDFQAIA